MNTLSIIKNKRVVLALGMIVVVSAILISGTGAFFSDSESSTGNVFTAGAIDLKVDSEQHYNNAVCEGGVWVVANPTVPQYPVEGSECGGTWGQDGDGLDIVNEQFFNFGDIKPGDEGENTISLHVVNNDAWVCADVSNLANDDNGLTEPESLVDSTDGAGDGELQQTMLWKVWRDDGLDEFGHHIDGAVPGDNIYQDGEVVLTEGNPSEGSLSVYDSTTGTGPLVAGTTGYVGVAWSLPGASGNETQTDSLTGDIGFSVVQSRNNGEFVCGESDVTTGDVSNEDFANDLGDWEINTSSTGSILALQSGHAITDGDAFTRWGGYSSEFPVGGYTTSVDVYLDMASSTGGSDDAYFDFSSAINNQAGNHLRDFIFHVGHTSVAGNWSASVSNNSSNDSSASQPDAPHLIGTPALITTTGWYTLQSYFHDVAGVLVVTMNLRDSSNTIVGTWTLTNSADDIAGTVGGNRYGWFSAQPFNPLAFDNARLYLGAPTI